MVIYTKAVSVKVSDMVQVLYQIKIILIYIMVNGPTIKSTENA